MQAIAAENNLTETAFTVPSERDEHDYDLRWFTPTVEVNLCGHATLAAAHILMHGERIRFATQSGILTVTREGDLLAARPAGGAGRAGRIARADQGAGRRPARPSSAARAMAMRSSCSTDEAAVRAVAPGFRGAGASCPIWCRSPRRATAGHRQPGVRRLPRHRRGSGHRVGPHRAGAVLGQAPRPQPLHRPPGEQAHRGVALRARGDRVILGGHCVTVIVGHFEL